MSEVTLEERGRALENQFYEKENKEKLAAMKSKLDTQSSKEDLRKVSGMTDDAVLEKLVHLGMSANTIAALSLVPLILGAWADGQIQDYERSAILQGAHDKNHKQSTPSNDQQQTKHAKRPSDELL